MPQRRFPGFDENIISMYARGMTVREIQGHLEDVAVTQTYLDEQGVTVLSSDGGGIYTSPGDGCGAMVVFQQS